MMESQPREIERFLCGGDKSTQEQDIAKAKEYLLDYEKRENTNQ